MNGRESYNNRLNKLNELKNSYQQEGYNVVLVPVFNESDKKENTASRVKFIQEKLIELAK